MSGKHPSRGARLFAVAIAIGLVLTAGALALYAAVPTVAGSGHEHPGATGSASPAAAAVPSLPPNEVYGVEATVAVGPNPVGVAYDASNGYLYITNSQGDNVTVLNGATQKVVANLAVGANPAGVAYDSANQNVYVVNSMEDSVSIISSENVVAGNFTVPYEPTGIAFDSASGNLYITQQGSNSTSVYEPSDSNKLAATLQVGLQPIGTVYDANDNEVYVANSNSSNVSVIDAATNVVVTSIPVGMGPLGLAYDSGQSELFVANDESNDTTIISTSSNTVVTTVATGVHPDGAAYNPSLGIVTIADEGSGQVSVILDSNNSIVSNVSVGVDPVGVAWDSANGYEYVANANSSTVSVLGTPTLPPYAVTFTETGLSSGASWTVSLAGTPITIATPSTAFAEVNGSYAYTVTPIAGYVGTNLTGTVHVAGFPVNVAVTFSLVLYTITFVESGLSAGALWAVSLNGTSVNSATENVTFSMANGSYYYTIPSVSGYTSTPTSGWSNVSGHSNAVNVAFTKVPGGPGSSATGSIGGVPLWEIAVIVAAIAAVVVGVLWSMRRGSPPAAGAGGSGTQ
jgi:YVTN family beta-propeller protein